MKHRPELDGIRGVAILGVLLDHSALAHGGQQGVTVFFVLSGYLITSLLLSEHDRSGRMDMAGFYRRRAARLLPALFVVVPVAVGLGLWLGLPGRQLAVSATATLTYGTNFLIVAGLPVVLFDWAWSLALEEQFYLVWPWVLRARRSPLFVPSILVVVGLVIAGRAHEASINLGVAYAAPWFRADALLIGGLLAMHPLRLGRFGGWMSVAGLAALYAFTSPTPRNIALATPAAAIFTATLIAGSDRLPVLAWAPLRYLGRISYALYLWNSMLKEAWQVFGDYPAGPVGTAAWLVLSLGLAHLSTMLLEEPLRARLRTRRPIAAPSPSIAAAVS